MRSLLQSEEQTHELCSSYCCHHYTTFLGYKEQTIKLFTSLGSVYTLIRLLWGKFLFKHPSQCWIGSPPVLPGWWPVLLLLLHQVFSSLMAPYPLPLFCSVMRLLSSVSFSCFYESLSTLPTLQFYILITTVHQAGFHLERAALCQAYHLIHQRPVRQPPLCCTLPSLGHHVQPHSLSLFSAVLWKHPRSLPACSSCVAKTTLSKTVGMQATLVLISTFNVWSYRDRQPPARHPGNT